MTVESTPLNELGFYVLPGHTDTVLSRRFFV